MMLLLGVDEDKFVYNDGVNNKKEKITRVKERRVTITDVFGGDNGTGDNKEEEVGEKR